MVEKKAVGKDLSGLGWRDKFMGETNCSVRKLVIHMDRNKINI